MQSHHHLNANVVLLCICICFIVFNFTIPTSGESRIGWGVTFKCFFGSAYDIPVTEPLALRTSLLLTAFGSPSLILRVPKGVTLQYVMIV